MSRFVSIFRLVVLPILAAVTLGLAAPAASAAPETKLDANLAALWTTVFQTPSAQNPFGTGGPASGCLNLGRTVAPFGPSGVPSCTVKPGTKIFVAASSFECSTFEGNGTTDAELQACATQMDVQTAPKVAVDGRSVPVTEAETGLLNIVLPADNIFGLPAGATGLSFGHGWVWLLNPLTPGTHIIVGPTFTTFDPMSAQVNDVGGQKIIQDVHVSRATYDPIRDAVVAQLQDRMAGGPFVPASVAQQIPSYLAELGYQWAPNIGAIEPALPDEQSRIVARFLVGHLLFAGYAQMSGLPHVLSPRRGRLMAAAGLPVGSGVPAAEAAVWQKVGERLADAPGWRSEELPWTPSFLPYLLQRTNKQHGGTKTLLQNALDLRSKTSVEKYRKIRRAALGAEEADDTVKARHELADAAASVAKGLESEQEEFTYTRSFVVGAGPAAIGYAGGAGMGMLIGGPPGAFIGGLVGVVAPEMLKPATQRLWGWVIDRLPFISARKLLSRSALAEAEVGASLAVSVREVWRRGYK